MKYYSEVLDKLFDTKEELIEKEAAEIKAKADKEKAEAIKAAKQADAKKAIEEKIEESNELEKEITRMIREYNKEFGAFKTSKIPAWSFFHDIFDF